VVWLRVEVSEISGCAELPESEGCRSSSRTGIIESVAISPAP
jgi:hypothetical protein